MSAVPDPLPAAVRRYLQVEADLSDHPACDERRLDMISARSAMSNALAQHGKVEAMHAAAIPLADWCVDGKAWTRCHPEQLESYSAAKAACESNQEPPVDDEATIEAKAFQQLRSVRPATDAEVATMNAKPSAPATAEERARTIFLTNEGQSSRLVYCDREGTEACIADQIRAAEAAARADERAKQHGEWDSLLAENGQLRARLAAQPPAWHHSLDVVCMADQMIRDLKRLKESVSGPLSPPPAEKPTAEERHGNLQLALEDFRDAGGSSQRVAEAIVDLLKDVTP